MDIKYLKCAFKAKPHKQHLSGLLIPDLLG